MIDAAGSPDAAAPADVLRYVRRLVAVVAAMRPDLVGVYLHGSAALGAFDPAGSDVDVLVVVGEPSTEADQRRLGEVLFATAEPCPGTGLELSVVTAATAATLGTCPFEVHVATHPDEREIVVGAGHPGDPDLVLHVAVCREHAIAVSGPPPAQVFGAVPRERVLAALVTELRWGIAHGPGPYAVLNACRAVRFAADGTLCSKVAGGDWYLARHPGHPVVVAALSDQRRGARPALTPAAVRFVTDAITRLGLAIPDQAK